ncbi:MAG: hypothetical protein M0Z77_08245 [Thermoplasmatales archaeon]|jgi:hypothetical protein|nr:hypothetical protein [Candidatus Thermoplasmatota archaeon]MCL6003335.1 hypothetical protein [Candidatus Thermoplasmatota archaeon]MDA8055617.1 hypothetical protein [Thermoplasmatales archaeon]
MTFPTEAEQKEYASYLVKTLKIVKDGYRFELGTDPSEETAMELVGMMAVHFGKQMEKNGFQQKLPQDQPQSNSNSVKNDNKSPSSKQPKNQPTQQQKPSQPQGGWRSEVLRLLNEFLQNLERKSQSKIKIVKEIPRSDWNNVKKGFEKEGWKYDWTEKAFVISEERKA